MRRRGAPQSRDPASAAAEVESFSRPDIGLNRYDSSRFSFVRAIDLCDFRSRMYIEMCVFPSVEPAEKCEGVTKTAIQSWGFMNHDKTKMLIVPDTSPIGRMLNVQLPHRLLIEEGITLYYDKALFLRVLEESKKRVV